MAIRESATTGNGEIEVGCYLSHHLHLPGSEERWVYRIPIPCWTNKQHAVLNLGHSPLVASTLITQPLCLLRIRSWYGEMLLLILVDVSNWFEGAPYMWLRIECSQFTLTESDSKTWTRRHPRFRFRWRLVWLRQGDRRKMEMHLTWSGHLPKLTITLISRKRMKTNRDLPYIDITHYP